MFVLDVLVCIGRDEGVRAEESRNPSSLESCVGGPREIVKNPCVEDAGDVGGCGGAGKMGV